MKSLLTLAAVMTIVGILLPATGLAQLDCPGFNRVAITFDAECTQLDLHNDQTYFTFNAYFWLVNVDASVIGGWEVGYDVSDTAIPGGITFPVPGALNVGTMDNMIVGLGSPQPVIDGRVLLCTQFFFYNSPELEPLLFNLHPTEPASIEGQMVFVANGTNLTAAYPISEDFDEPVAAINGPFLDYCQGLEINGVTVGIASQGDNDNVAGASSTADDGFNVGLDLIDDGADPVVYFFHPEWNNPQGDRYKQDIIAGFDEHAETRTWSFVVDSEIPAGQTPPYEVSIDFTPSFADDPFVLMTLVDTSTGMITLLEAPYTFSYAIEADESRVFELTVGDDTVYPPVPLLDLQVDVTCNGLADLGNHAGADGGATDGFDSGLDTPEPGPPPGDYLVASFWNQSWPLGPRFRTMIHGPFDLQQDFKEWPLRVETDQEGTVLLEFTPSFEVGDGIVLYLRDESTDEVFDLLPDLSFAFENTNPSQREFTIFMGNVGPPPPSPTARTLQQGWNLVGVPVEPPEDENTIWDVFMNPYPEDTYVFRYDNPTGYVEETANNLVVTGRGYWLAVPENRSWTRNGELRLDPVPVELSVGWNLVGYPLWFSGNIQNATIVHDGNEYSWPDAADAGLIFGTAVHFSPYLQLYQDTELMTPYFGYWLAALVPDLTVVFDWHDFVDPPWSRRPPALHGFPADQSWRTEVTATTRDRQVYRLTFGVHPLGTEGFDTRLDIPLMPSSPGAAGRFGVLRPEWDLPTGNTIMRDIIGPDAREFFWDAEIVTSGSGPVILEWNNRDWPSDMDLQIYLPRENRVLVTSMRETNRLQLSVRDGYEVVRFRTPMTSGVGDTPAASFSLAAYPNPFNPRTHLKFNLARAGDAAVRVYNLRGELVSQLEVDGAAAGPHSLEWNGTDRAGRSVPSGSYFAKLFLDGEAVGPITKMSLVR